ncbi:MAG TPA: hypothetical protein P5511_00900 [Candidatus Goldiibacteriota bacterium]|nr:hypothetical protein [Candidatus Goldiibacteriota bacterium]
MKKFLFILISVVLVFYSFGCKSNTSPSDPAQQNTATATVTSTPADTITSTVTSTMTVTSTITETSTPTVTATMLTKWDFDGSTEGWQAAVAGFTAFTSAAYSTADYANAPGCLALTCNFTGTGGANSQGGRAYVDCSSNPVNVTGKGYISASVLVPAGMIDNAPPYTLTVYVQTDGSPIWVSTGTYNLTSAGGWSGAGWNLIGPPLPSGAVSLEGMAVIVEKPDAAPDISGTMYLDMIYFY